ncbi:MAG: hypothetical protein HC810_01590 [Acaryochloridaceae cyanobacterium RL_2_7]|nr:hypothetical protein [Acaryochloridaceae cyanobacterium RL_2_7]
MDKFEPLWFEYGHELSQEERLILNLGFGISSEALSYLAIAKRLNFRDSSNVGRLIEDALKHLIHVAKQPRTEGVGLRSYESHS